MEFQYLKEGIDYRWTTDMRNSVTLNNGELLRGVQSPNPLSVAMIVKDNKLIPVVVLDGTYLDGTYSRVSNFWYWREVAEDLTLSEKKSGYGAFYEVPLGLRFDVDLQVSLKV